MRQIPPPQASKRLTLGASVLTIGLSIMLLLAPAAAAAPRTTLSQTNDGLAYGQQTRFGKSHLVQDPKWYAAKVARRNRLLHIGTDGSVSPLTSSGFAPASFNLSTSVTGSTFEPLGNGPNNSPTSDAIGHPYTDGYFWGFCGEGATTVAMGYWNSLHAINNNGTHSYSDPHTTTTWDDNNNRSYLVWLGTTVKPPTFGTPGEFAYSTYPTGTTYTTDLQDTLNWEASREGALGSWSNYYYGIVWAANLTQSQLMADIQADIGIDQHADVVDVNTAYLPSWVGTGKALSHYVAITGYNTLNNTLTYVDTCGTGCGSLGNGVYTISLSQLYNGIENNNGNGSLVW